MIRINFCRTGASVSDWDVEDKVAYIKRMALIDKEVKHLYSNFLLFDALRAEIAEGKLSLDNICFSVDDVPLKVNRYGVPERWPHITEQKENFSVRVLRAAMELRKHEKEKCPCLVKTDAEGQAPVSTGDSTTSGEG